MFISSDNNYFWRAWIIVLSALLIAGVIYRSAAAKQQLIESQASLITIPLKEFPLKIKDWSGEDVMTDYPIAKATGCNDYMLRVYRNADRQWVNVYITFSAQPRKMIGHRPEVCFTASGWNIIKEAKTQFTTALGRRVPCVEFLFEKPVWPNDEMSVLNFYIFNGNLTDNHKNFSGIKWRRLKDDNEQFRYVTQIQISSSEAQAAKKAATEMTDLIINYFPKK
ncbi:MAG: exosortase C-terminal domain/associated protein EpsI [Phycisphaerales bacterium]